MRIKFLRNLLLCSAVSVIFWTAGCAHPPMRQQTNGTPDRETTRNAIESQIEKELTAAGIMQTGDTLVPTADGRGLLLTTGKPTTATSLRKALARGGDIYALGNVSGIEVAEPGELTGDFAVHLRDLATAADPKDVWIRALKALMWANVQTQVYTVQKCDLSPDKTTVVLALDRPVDRQVMESALVRRGFDGFQVSSTVQRGTQFTLTGGKELMERFRRQLPVGGMMLGVPDVHIEKDTITVGLLKKLSEADISACFRRQGLSNVDVVPLDIHAQKYRLNLQ